MTKLKKAAFMVVAQCLKPEEIKHLRDLFRSIDANGDGTITAEELKVTWQSTTIMHLKTFQSEAPEKLQTETN